MTGSPNERIIRLKKLIKESETMAARAQSAERREDWLALAKFAQDARLELLKHNWQVLTH